MLWQSIRSVDTQLISEDDIVWWLSRGGLETETDCDITAAKDKALQTKHHATKILQTQADYVSNIITKKTTLYQHANIGKRTIVCPTTLYHMQASMGKIRE